MAILKKLSAKHLVIQCFWNFTFFFNFREPSISPFCIQPPVTASLYLGLANQIAAFALVHYSRISHKQSPKLSSLGGCLRGSLTRA